MVFGKLYIGSEESSKDCERLRLLGVTHIVTVTGNAHFLFPDAFKYLHVPILDDPQKNILPYLSKFIPFISNVLANKGGVLVYCSEGTSQSVAVVISFLMFERRMTYANALAFVKLKRSTAKPNYGFAL